MNCQSLHSKYYNCQKQEHTCGNLEEKENYSTKEIGSLPELVPQMVGGDFPPGTVTLNESVSQLPILLAFIGVAVVMSVAVTGLFITNVSKSSLS